MNILFVLYGDLTSNSANPLGLYARALSERGHDCVVAIPSDSGEADAALAQSLKLVLYADLLAQPQDVFANGRGADVVHAWTPRENVWRVVAGYLAHHPAPLVVYLEDHESWISARALALDDTALYRQTSASLAQRMPAALSHPFNYRSFIALADLVLLIQGKLVADAPAWALTQTVLPGVDLDFFSPRPASASLRQSLGMADGARVIVYPGGVNGFTRPGIVNLCLAVGLLNDRCYPCKLLRTGPFALDFLDELPESARQNVVDLGAVPRQQLPDLLALADVLVQPGKPDPFEDLRLPGKLPELLAMGKPVVLPDTNIAHMFRDGVDAVITHTGTPQEIAEKCIGLFADPEHAKRIGQAGRQFAQAHFDIQTQTTRLEQAYGLAIDAFSADMAASVWQGQVPGDSANSLLIKKLAWLACKLPDKAMAKLYDALMQQMVFAARREGGLESVINDCNTHVGNLDKILAANAEHAAGLSASNAQKDVQLQQLNQSLIAAQASYADALLGKDQTIAELAAESAALKHSWSWRLTRPLRALQTLLR